MKLDQNDKKQADFTVFALDPWGAHASFAPRGYAGHLNCGILVTALRKYLSFSDITKEVGTTKEMLILVT